MEHILFKTKHTEWNLLHSKKKKGIRLIMMAGPILAKKMRKKKPVLFLGHIFRTAPI